MHPVKKIMYSPGPLRGFDPLAYFLWGISKLYGAAMGARASMYKRGWLKSWKPPLKIVSVGNLTLGGTGKTPMTLAVAEIIQDMGLAVAVASRGYGGSAVRSGGLVSDKEKMLMSPDQAGDEPWLLASRLSGVPVAVGRDRVASGLMLARQFGTRVLVLDDGFQHMRIQRDADLLLLDASSPLGNGHVFPRGILREPVNAVQRAGAVVLTRYSGGSLSGVKDISGDRPLFTSAHAPSGFLSCRAFENTGGQDRAGRFDLGHLKGQQVFAFSGIADNQGFLKSLADLGVSVLGSLSFADHHAFDANDRKNILKAASRAGADCLVTTEKDLVRLVGWDTGKMPLLALEIRLVLHQKQEFINFLKDRVED